MLLSSVVRLALMALIFYSLSCCFYELINRLID